MRFAWILIGMLIVIGGACESAARKIPVRMLAIEGDAEVSEQAREMCRTTLAASPHIRLDPEADVRALVIYRQMDVGSEHALRVMVRLDGLSEGEREAIEATVELVRDRGPVDMNDDLPIAMQRAVVVLDAKLSLRAGDTKVARRLLRADDPALVVLALEWVTQTRRADLIDDVLPLLHHIERKVAVAAVDAVGAIGSAEHAAALIDAAQLFDRDHTGRLYEALGRLGGPNAQGFLAFAARNEDDAPMAQMAQHALDQLSDARPVVARRPESHGHR